MSRQAASHGAVPDDTPVAPVTGANRGIGLEVTRQLACASYLVILGARDLEKGARAAQQIAAPALQIMPRQIDDTDCESISRLAGQIADEVGRLDVLVNNAALLYDTWQSAVNADLAEVQVALETNLFGAWRLCQAVIPLMRARHFGRIVNVSSEAGSLAPMGAGTPAYAVSKAAQNALTRILAAEVRGTGILVNAVCPGWVATNMGGPGGRPVAEGAASVVYAAMLPDDGPTGGFFRDGKPLPW